MFSNENSEMNELPHKESVQKSRVSPEVIKRLFFIDWALHEGQATSALQKF